ncbi:MAG: hypothetical protein WCK67_12445 [bacterium]
MKQNFGIFSKIIYFIISIGVVLVSFYLICFVLIYLIWGYYNSYKSVMDLKRSINGYMEIAYTLYSGNNPLLQAQILNRIANLYSQMGMINNPEVNYKRALGYYINSEWIYTQQTNNLKSYYEYNPNREIYYNHEEVIYTPIHVRRNYLGTLIIRLLPLKNSNIPRPQSEYYYNTAISYCRKNIDKFKLSEYVFERILCINDIYVVEKGFYNFYKDPKSRVVHLKRAIKVYESEFMPIMSNKNLRKQITLQVNCNCIPIFTQTNITADVAYKNSLNLLSNDYKDLSAYENKAENIKKSEIYQKKIKDLQ